MFEFRNDYHGKHDEIAPYHIYNKELDYWMSDDMVCKELSRLAKIDADQQSAHWMVYLVRKIVQKIARFRIRLA